MKFHILSVVKVINKYLLIYDILLVFKVGKADVVEVSFDV